MLKDLRILILSFLPEPATEHAYRKCMVAIAVGSEVFGEGGLMNAIQEQAWVLKYTPLNSDLSYTTMVLHALVAHNLFYM